MVEISARVETVHTVDVTVKTESPHEEKLVPLGALPKDAGLFLMLCALLLLIIAAVASEA